MQLMKKTEDTAQLFEYKCFSVSSGGMEQTLQIGDLVITKEKEQKDIFVKYEDVEGVYVNHIPQLGKVYI